MLSVRGLIRVLRFPLQEVSDWIPLARPSQLDYGAVAEVSLYLAGVPARPPTPLFTQPRRRGILRSSSKQSSLRSRVNKGVGILSPRPQLYVFPLIRSELRPRPPPSGARILLRLPFGDPCRHALSCLVSLRSPARSVWFVRLVLLLPWPGGGASDPSAY